MQSQLNNIQEPSSEIVSLVESILTTGLSPENDSVVEQILIKALQSSIIPDFKYATEHLSVFDASSEFQELFQEVLSTQYFIRIDKLKEYSSEYHQTTEISEQCLKELNVVIQEAQILLSPKVIYSYLESLESFEEYHPYLKEDKTELSLDPGSIDKQRDEYYSKLFYRACSLGDTSMLKYLCETLPDADIFPFKKSPIDNVQHFESPNCPLTIRFQLLFTKFERPQGNYGAGFIEETKAVFTPMNQVSNIDLPNEFFTHRIRSDIPTSSLRYLSQISTEYEAKRQCSSQSTLSLNNVSQRNSLSAFVLWKLGYTSEDTELMSSGFPKYAIFPKAVWDAGDPKETLKQLNSHIGSQNIAIYTSLLQELRKLDNDQFVEYLSEFLNSEERFSIELLQALIQSFWHWEKIPLVTEAICEESDQLTTVTATELAFGEEVYRNGILPQISKFSEDSFNEFFDNFQKIRQYLLKSIDESVNYFQSDFRKLCAFDTNLENFGKTFKAVCCASVKLNEKPFQVLNAFCDKFPETVLQAICSSDEQLYKTAKLLTDQNTDSKSNVTKFAL